MCLISKTKVPLIASKDIVCYKVLIKKIFNLYHTPYMYEDVSLNKILKATGIKDICLAPITLNYSVSAGFIHAYIDKTFACKVAKQFNHSYVFKSIIKKGSEYFLDMDGFGICANEIFITDEIICASLLMNLNK